MERWVGDYVRSCVKCQQNKDGNTKTTGLLMPLPVPSRPWQVVGIDFIGPLPKSKSGYDMEMTVVDYLTKEKHLIPTTQKLTSKGAVALFIREVVRLHGVPEVVVSDRDVRFTAGFWTEFWKEWQTKLGMGTAYHPQTDGQTERENKTVEEIITSLHQ